MNKKTKNILCIIGIIILVIIIIISTFIKYISDQKSNNNNNKFINNKNNNIDDTINEASNNLYCTSLYYDNKNTNANIKEEITIEFDTDNNPISQKYIKIYTFEKKEEYEKYKIQFEKSDNQLETNDNENSITISKKSDYSTPYNSNDKMDFRTKTYLEIKEYLTTEDYICN